MAILKAALLSWLRYAFCYGAGFAKTQEHVGVKGFVLGLHILYKISAEITEVLNWELSEQSEDSSVQN